MKKAPVNMNAFHLRRARPGKVFFGNQFLISMSKELEGRWGVRRMETMGQGEGEAGKMKPEQVSWRRRGEGETCPEANGSC